MKRICMVVALALCSLAAVASMNPRAIPEAVVTDGKARFTVLCPEMIRIEYSPSGVFEDNATFAVINRELPVPRYEKTDDGEFLTIATDALILQYRKGTNPLTEPASPDNLIVSLTMGGKTVTWYPGMTDSLNLKGTYRTLDGNDGDAYRRRLEDGLISRSGWAVINDSPSFERADGSRSLSFVSDAGGVDWAAPRADAEALDLYFLGYGHNYKKALYDFTRIAGKIPLPPDYVLGYWYSKYDNYSADDFRNIIKSMRDNDINADVLILDMDWHWNGEQEVSGGRGGWTGWSWNTNLIPDPEGLLADIHRSGLHAALNLHPADGVAAHEDRYKEFAAAMGCDTASTETIPWMLENRRFAKVFFDTIIRPLERQGVDFWWLDWQQHLVNPRLDGLGETMWCNHVFFSDMKKNRTDRRPVIFHRWGGLGSHRYQIGFSGDTYINYPTLAFEPYFTATASNVGYGYWGHDLGGHMINYYEPNDPELLLRWMQFGVFTPIFRTHATKGGHIERRISTYDNFPLINETVKLRYALFPYLYTMARKAYDTGVGLCRPLYYDYPESDEAYRREDQYFFGDDILVAPVVEPSADGLSRREVWFPEGNWWSVAHSRLIAGDTVRTLGYTLAQIPYFYRQGAVIVKNPPEVKHVTERPASLILDIVAGADGGCELYEDAGDNADYATVYAKTAISHRQEGRKAVYTIGERKGTYRGMPASRAYRLRIFNTPKPVSVRAVAGTVTRYDAASRCTTIDIPSQPCDKPITATVEYSE